MNDFASISPGSVLVKTGISPPQKRRVIFGIWRIRIVRWKARRRLVKGDGDTDSNTNAYAALANGGILMRPRIVDRQIFF